MYYLLRLASAGTVLLTFGSITGVVTPATLSLAASAQENLETTPNQTAPPSNAKNEQRQSFSKQNTENEGEIDVDIEDEDVEVDLEPRLNYIGIGGNIGLGGDSAIGEGSFAVYGKVGLTPNVSARPAIAINDDPTILLPVTYDFNFRSVDPVEGEGIQPFSAAPFIGGGLGIETGDDADVGFLITGGVDVPINDKVMLTGTANVLFIDDTDFGLTLGIGYRF